MKLFKAKYLVLIIILIILLSPFIIFNKNYGTLGSISIFPKANNLEINNQKAYFNAYVPLLTYNVNTAEIQGNYSYIISNIANLSKIVSLAKDKQILSTINIDYNTNGTNFSLLSPNTKEIVLYFNNKKYVSIIIPDNTINLKLLYIVDNGVVSLYFSNYIINSSWGVYNFPVYYDVSLLYKSIFMSLSFPAYIAQDNKVIETKYQASDKFLSEYLPNKLKKQGFLENKLSFNGGGGYVAVLKAKAASFYKHLVFTTFKILLTLLISIGLTILIAKRKNLLTIFSDQPFKDKVIFIILLLFCGFVVFYFKTQLYSPADIIQQFPIFG